VWQHLDITLRAELMAAGFQVLAQGLVVVHLAIAY
jgi:hypothetical protein